MISTKLIGGLSNNLFQIAMLVAYSLRHNLPYCIPNEITNPHSKDQKVFYSKFLNYCKKENKFPIYLEKGFNYEEIPYLTNICFQGYWQSGRYFNDYREQILNILNIPYEIKKGWCSIHVRRGDYLKLPTIHPVVSVDYILNAMLEMMWRTGCENFLIFSDDIEWCKQNIHSNVVFTRRDKQIRLGANIEYSENKNEVEDLSLASSCQYNIGCNSSFSWWIYYLNRSENKGGIFPQKDKWFGSALPHNVDDLYMPQWILV